MRSAHTPDETIRLGQERYEREIRAQVERDPGNRGKLLALDVDSGDFALGDDSLAALNALRAQRPGATPYLLRVGFPTAVRIGAGRRDRAGTNQG
jgi:hypothetical protein